MLFRAIGRYIRTDSLLVTVFKGLRLERHLNLCLFGPLVMLFNICKVSLQVSALFLCFRAVKLALTIIGKIDRVLPKIKEEEK